MRYLFLLLLLSATSASAAPVDLMPLIDPAKALLGNWDKKDVLSAKTEGTSKLLLPLENIPLNYELRFGITPSEKTAVVALGLVVNSKPVHLFIDFSEDKKYTSGPAIGGSHPSSSPSKSNPRHYGRLLIPNEPNKVVCKVQNNKVTVEVNDKNVLSWVSKDSEVLDIREWWGETKHFWIGCTSDKEVKFQEIVMTVLQDIPVEPPQQLRPAPVRNDPLLLAKQTRTVATFKKSSFPPKLVWENNRVVEFYAKNSSFDNAQLRFTVEGLPWLRLLHLEGTSINDEGIAHITPTNLPDLGKLNLAAVSISEQEEANLKQRFPAVDFNWELSQEGYKTADLFLKRTLNHRPDAITIRVANGKHSYVQMMECTPAHVRLVGSMTRLEHLGITYSQIDKQSYFFLRHFTNLKELNLRCSDHVDDDVIKFIVKNNPKLVVLDLSLRAEYTDAALSDIATLKSIQSLSLDGGQTLGLKDAKQIEKMESLVNFYASSIVEQEVVPSLVSLGRKNLRKVGIGYQSLGRGISIQSVRSLRNAGITEVVDIEAVEYPK